MTQDENKDTLIELSLDELAFVTAYFKNNMNGTRAYMSLHPKSSYDAARSSAPEILAKPSVKAEIKRILTEQAMGAEEAVYRMGAIAKADLYPFIRIDDDGFTYFNFADVDAREHLFLIKKMKTKRERRIEGQGENAEEWEGEWVEVELHDAYAALRDIAKMHGKLTDRHEITGKDGKDLIPVTDNEKVLDRVNQLLELAKQRKEKDAS